MTQFLQTIRVVEHVSQEDIEAAKITGKPPKPTEVFGRYTVDLEQIVAFAETFGPSGNHATSILLKTGHARTLAITYAEFKAAHDAHFVRGYNYQLNAVK